MPAWVSPALERGPGHNMPQLCAQATRTRLVDHDRGQGHQISRRATAVEAQLQIVQLPLQDRHLLAEVGIGEPTVLCHHLPEVPHKLLNQLQGLYLGQDLLNGLFGEGAAGHSKGGPSIWVSSPVVRVLDRKGETVVNTVELNINDSAAAELICLSSISPQFHQPIVGTAVCVADNIVQNDQPLKLVPVPRLCVFRELEGRWLGGPRTAGGARWR
mmetsp:Transcript_73689/g.129882  ORF Transcript_73689/g.129882 Transcript_73689/m.129882 type:complete len:215 (+) Transcript_73689:109-753(+)